MHRAGGPEILEECKKIVENQGRCEVGEAVITTAGKLPSGFVIHTVGPVWNGGSEGEPEKLATCYKNSLKLAVENNCRTIAFPNISTGVYGYPKKQAAEVAVKAVSGFLAETNRPEKVVFVCFDEEN
ncbi:RNase III inhibitor, partial [Flavobacterium sp. IR1]